MRTHPEAVWNRLKSFRFFVNAGFTPPEPRLVHERPVRRIHQADDSMIDVRWQFAFEPRDLVSLAEFLELRYSGQLFRQPCSLSVQIYPDVAVALFTGEVAGADPLHFQLVVARERRNRDAAPAAGIEFPAVVTAREPVTVKVPVGKGYSSVRAGITHRKRPPLACPAEHQRHFEQHRGNEATPTEARARHRRIPEIPQEIGIRR